MPLIPSQGSRHFTQAKKRMKLGLHPAVLEAVERVARGGLRSERLEPGVRPSPPQGFRAPNPGAGRQVALGGGVNQAKQHFERFLQQDPEGGLRELHVYGTGADRRVMAFNRLRQPPPEVMAKLNQSPRQQLARTATADDKLAAIALRLGQRRKFSRNPGPMRRY